MNHPHTPNIPPVSSDHLLIAINHSTEGYAKLPVYEYFRGRPHYTIYLNAASLEPGHFLARHFPQAVVRAAGKAGRMEKVCEPRFDELLLRVEDGVFIEVLGGAVHIHADREALAGQWCRKLEEVFQTERRSLPPAYLLIKSSMLGMDTKEVPLKETVEFNESSLRLNYGDEFPGWERQFCEILQSSVRGATMLRGEPGTGKTTFLRHLICKLVSSHVFFYLPTRLHSWLTDPDMIDFWVEQNDAHSRKRVLIVEDAEDLLAERAGDNRGAVSDILNITDGLVGDFLNLHLVFTVNCRLDRIDPAILRSGRLLAFREFRRLSRGEAEKLADDRGIQLRPQQDYSLADIYNSESPFRRKNNASIGFVTV